MKVLLAITKSNWGGAQRYVFDVATVAKEAGHEVVVICGGDGPLVKKLKEENIRIISLPKLGRDFSIWHDCQNFFEILHQIQREHPDILHANSSKMGGLGVLAGRMTGVRKIIFVAHGWAFNENRSWFQKLIIKKLAWWTIALSHKTICVSEKMKQDISYFPFIQNKLVVIHNGIKEFKVSARTEKVFTIGTLSELHHIKGLDIALQGFAKVFKDKQVRFVIMGDGEERYRLGALAKDLGIEKQVHFGGFVPNAREHLLEFDIFTLTSRSEGLPYTLLEAGIASLPVIASRVGGIPEVVKDDETGLLFESGDIDALANCLEKLHGNPELRKRLGQNLHTLVNKDFNQTAMLKKTIALYQ